ncbi:Scramblase-domain-containing protein [Lentinula aciculospora]|uniref:Phospholipid scramblase n=1 Tax=Lentinula aciculospora TaxID=153920 RepID=A0A9W9AR18_9AGAR|nr:Scramblase-domain-containing protein [Lentinula aciculospora]
MLPKIYTSVRFATVLPSNACRRRPSTRHYAISRFPGLRRPVGGGRRQSSPLKRDRQEPPEEFSATREPHEVKSSVSDSPLWRAGESLDASGSSEGLKGLLANDSLIVERQIEMLNVFIGFEQTNKYSISNSAGEQVGFIAEEPGSFLSSFNRQIFATHRPFKALVMDPSGTPILWVRRPFAWINSRMFVQCPHPGQEVADRSSAILDTFAEVQQIWHPFRRRYDLFLRDSPKRILSLASDPQPEPELDTNTFNQIAKVDAPFLAWDFSIRDAASQEMAFISRNFRGLGREIFTDTSTHCNPTSTRQYLLHFGPRPQVDATGNILINTQVPALNLEQRALILALAVNVDFDYFSRHSGGP